MVDLQDIRGSDINENEIWKYDANFTNLKQKCVYITVEFRVMLWSSVIGAGTPVSSVVVTITPAYHYVIIVFYTIIT